MKQWKTTILAASCAIGLTLASSADIQPSVPTRPAAAMSRSDDIRRLAESVDSLLRELTSLKKELRQVKIEQHRLRVASLERDVEEAKGNRLRIDTQVTLVQQDIDELNENLSQPLDSDSYARLMDSKATITGGRAQLLSNEQRIAVQREAEAMKLLDLERQRLQVLVQ